MRRRDILTIAALSAISPWRASAQVPSGYDKPKYVAPENAPSNIIVTHKDEPGERLIVTGQVSDGTAPLRGVSIYVFQADAKGLYVLEDPGDDHNARLHGALRTDDKGLYRFATIRPGDYGGPTHVHYVVTAQSFRQRMVELWFEGDPRLAERRAAGRPEIPSIYPPGAVAIRPIVRDVQGICHSTRDIVLERI